MARDRVPASPGPRAWLPAALAAALLAGCGGGGGSSGSPPAEPRAGTASITLAGRVPEMRLQGATACLDLDGNGECGAAEPRSAASDADGRFSLQVPATLSGLQRLRVEVPADARDADTGAAPGRAFALAAPVQLAAGRADGEVAVSALSSLVLAQMDSLGLGAEEAAALVQREAALALPPLAGAAAWAGDTDAARHARSLSRLLLLLAAEQGAALAAEVGSTNPWGQVITAGDVSREVQRALFGALPLVNAAALSISADTTLAAAPAATRAAFFAEQAASLGQQLQAPRDAVRVAALMRRLSGPPVDLPGTSASLTALRWTNVDNWYIRYLAGSSADSVADANNNRRYYDARVESAGTGVDADGVAEGWSWNSIKLRADDLHWNGSAWVGCNLGTRHLVRVRDDQGRSVYDYCQGRLGGSSVQRVLDISGLPMEQVVRERIRSFPGNGSGVSFSAWGPNDFGLYGSAVFPPGSQLLYQSNVQTTTAITYIPTSPLPVYSAAVADGGDTRQNPALACNDPQQFGVGGAGSVQATTLEQVVQRSPGRPCIFAPQGTPPNQSLDPNIAWGNSSVFLGDVAEANTRPPGTGNFYNTTARLRVSFAAAGNRVTFHRCFARASDSAARNCSVLGIGRWRIESLGDARVMRFTLPPGLGTRIGFERVLVERGGLVWFGYKDPVGLVDNDVRLNLTAANAVLYQLGLPRIRPVTKPGTASGARAQALATLKGTLGSSSGDEAVAFRFGDDGRFFIAEAKPRDAQTRERSGAELGWFDYDPESRTASTLLEVDSNLTSGTSHPRLDDGTITISQQGISVVDGNGGATTTIARLATGSGRNLVGMWAMNSPTDLSQPHWVFFDDGRWMWVQHRFDPAAECFNSSNQCTPGVEFARWLFDDLSGRLTLNSLLYDTNGCAGAFNSCPAAVAAQQNNTVANVTITIAPDGNSFTFLDGNTPRTMYRVANR